MPIVYDEETLRQVKVIVRNLPSDYDNEIDPVRQEILTLLDEYGQDADDWANAVGYGYCEDCDGERFRDESRD